MKGFLGGVSIGALVAVAGAAVWSLSTPLPARVQVGTETSGQAATPASAEARPLIDGQNRDPDLVDAQPSLPEASVAGEVSPIAAVDTDPGKRPEVGEADGVGEGDTSQGRAISAPTAQVTDRVSVQSETDALRVPGGESDLEVSTQTARQPDPVDSPDAAPGSEVAASVAQNAATQQSDTQTAGVAVASSQNSAAAQSAQDQSTTAAPSIVASAAAPQIGNAPAATALPNITAPVPPKIPSISRTVSEPVDAGAPASEGGQSNTGSGSESVPLQSAEPIEAEQNDTSETNTVASALPTTNVAAVDTGPRIGTRVVPLTERARDDQPAPSNSPATSSTVTPFEANAQSYVAEGERPLMSIVLIDDEGAIGAEALVEFPYPLTFAIDPEDPKAAEKMRARRAAGFEVLILADLPREAAPQDAETALAVWMEQLPQAVGFLEGVETGYQGNRPLADQMVAGMQAAGYGMVTQNSGLNTVQKLALRDGLPSGVVFRDFDGVGQNPRAIRRFLDQAAFRARQEGAVIMLGRLRPETISALLLWGLQDRASQVGLAPVSAALKANLAKAG